MIAKVKPAGSYIETGAPAIGPALGETENHGGSNGVKQSADPERQESEDERAAQFKGMPDVKKRMKYILPALSIGVGTSPCCRIEDY